MVGTDSGIMATALASAVGIILGLVGLLYKKLTQTDTDQQGQLDAGADEFTVQKIDVARVHKDLDSIRAWMIAIEKELDEFELKRLKDHESFLVLRDHHFRNHGERVE